ncbi:hypothetical protein DPMN_102315 [Dreissena polymorpha]|uniref:Uncharacterized protein n=1 Tax=Dreissena polymorpha TaxID=45954 RepID=A0A9D4R9S5_DREPO|nr:hypothetical protein DPMN_102315 [Dreissena polymorpha]
MKMPTKFPNSKPWAIFPKSGKKKLKGKVVILEKSKKELLSENTAKSKETGILKGALAKSKVKFNNMRSSLNNLRSNESQLKCQIHLKDQEINMFKQKLKEDEAISAKETEKLAQEAVEYGEYLTALMEDKP